MHVRLSTNMLTEKEIEEKFTEYCILLRSTKREGVEDLIEYLESTDFKYAPASTKYHGAYDGGLCDHSLAVFHILVKLIDTYIELKHLEFPNELAESHDELMNSVAIVALLHDISKVNTYEKTFINKKVYSESGSKWDENGRYDWQSIPGYKTREEETFVIGNHEETSEFIARQFIPLRISETAAIMHHHGGLGWDSVPVEAMSKVYTKYTLALLLHEADLLAAYKFV